MADTGGVAARTKQESPVAVVAVALRPYLPSDEDRVRAITVEGFAEVSVDAAIERRWPGLLPTSWTDRKWRSLRDELAQSPEGCFVAEIDHQVVGYVTTVVAPADATGRIPNLAVDQRARGRGIGRMLLERALAHFRARGLRLARIETLGHNEAGRHLYPSVGFTEVATQIHFAVPLDAAVPEATAPETDTTDDGTL